MRLLRVNKIQKALDLAINDRLCVQVWLGHANVLFAGFGDTLPDPDTYDIDTYRPTYQFQTGFADWWIEVSGRQIVESNEESLAAEAAAQTLVGRRAIGWRFVDPKWSIEIDFECDTVLKIIPYPSFQYCHEEAWHLIMPDHTCRMVRWDGTLFFAFDDESCWNYPEEPEDDSQGM